MKVKYTYEDLMKKIIICFGVLFILVLIAILIIDNNNDAKMPRLGTAVAIMVYDENTNEYIKSSEVPKGNYVLNEEKTKCTSGGKVSNYDSVNGTVTYSLDTADQCYVYFDILIKPVIKNVVTTDDYFGINIKIDTESDLPIKEYVYKINECGYGEEFKETSNQFRIGLDGHSATIIFNAIDEAGNTSDNYTLDVSCGTDYNVGSPCRPCDIEYDL